MYKPLPHPCKLLFVVIVCVATSTFAQPKIGTFVPVSGPTGTTVTVTGAGFNADPAKNIVYFGAARASIIGGSSTTLLVTVPAGATYKPLSVLNTGNGLTGYTSSPFVTTFANPFGTSIPNNFYLPKIDIVPGSTTSYIRTGDLDGDGKPDLVLVNENEGMMYVLRNISALGSVSPSSFAARTGFDVGLGGGQPAIGDVDGDGRLDVVITNPVSDRVLVFRNLSTPGSFTPSSLAAGVSFRTGGEPSYVALGDIDADGKTDMIISNRNGSSASVLRNTSAPGSITTASFAEKVDFMTGGRPNSVAVGDVDGDGKTDIVTANTQNSTLSVLRNTSIPGSITTASFAEKIDFTTSRDPFFAAIGDMDGDGKADLIAANASEANVSVLRNTSVAGSITLASFANKVDFTTGNTPATLAIGDADGDGKPDIIVANREQRYFSVLRNISSTGGITAASFANKMNFYVSGLPNDVVVFDVDGDGVPEVATANALSTTISVVKIAAPQFPPVITSFVPASGQAGTTVTIKGTNFFPAALYNTVFFGAARAAVLGGSDTSLTVTVPAGATYQPVSVMNGSNRLTGYAAKPFITTFPNPFGSGIPPNFYAPQLNFATGMLPYAVAMSDLDGDNKNDLVVVNAQSNSISVLRNTSTTGSMPAFAPRVDFVTGTDPRAIVIKDIDADGRPDIIVLNAASSTISVLRNNAVSGNINAESFAPKVDFAVGPVTYPYSVAVDDMDDDGRPDLLVANLLSGAVGILRNTSGSIQSSGFADREDFAVGVYPRYIATCDLDGDGKRDLAVANERSNTVSVLRNTTTTGYAFQFAGKVDFSIGTNPPCIAAGDIDGDGKPDLVTANYASNTLSVLRNTSIPGSISTSSFAPKVDFATGMNPFCVAMGDADGDGKTDLAVANANSNTVSILRNTSTAGSVTTSSFASKADFASTGYPMYVAMGDLNGDGIAEIAAANGAANTIAVLRVNIPVAAAYVEMARQASIIMTVYPNPAKGTLHLQLSNLKAPVVSLEVFDENGRIVHKEVLPVAEKAAGIQTSINLDKQPAGIYYIKASSITGISIAKVLLRL
ncbi:MAG: VCBS repeat-containing protein [Williamsia sp.]|nr:VCBS repeat-containing protein [Williamsia sp.]